MKTNSTGAVDMLDILFEHRNKAYGAYVLRRGYSGRVQTGLLASLVLAGIFAWMLRVSAGGLTRPDTRELTRGPVELIDLVYPPPPLPPAPPEAPAAGPRTVQDVVPVIVPNQTLIDHPVPTVDDLADAQPGTQTSDGDPNGQAGSTTVAGPGPAVAAAPPAAAEDRTVYDFRAVEVQAAFPGGDKALRRFLERQLQTPDEGKEGEPRTIRVMVKFIIDAKGQPGAFELLQSGGPAFDQEVRRVLARMPAWTPARQNGRDVAMYFILPVVFTLDGED